MVVDVNKCTCQEAILIVDDTEYNLLPLIYYIGQLRIEMAKNSSKNIDFVSASKHSSHKLVAEALGEEEKEDSPW